MLSGDNSILQKTATAKTQTGVGQEKETIALAYNSALTKKVGNGNSSAVTDSELNDELDENEATATGNPIIVTFKKSGNAYEIDNNGIIKESTPKDPSVTLKVADKRTVSGQAVTALSTTETTTLEDDLGNIVKVPKGFGISEDSGTKVEDGIVIEDVSHTDTKGSQFVWVPVGEITKEGGTKVIITLGRYKFNNPSEGTETPVQTASKTDYATGVAVEDYFYEYETIPNDIQDKNAIAKSLGSFISSAIDNGGYYIARYEAGIVETTDNWTNAGALMSYSMGGFDVSYSNQSALKLTDGSVKPLIIKGKGIWNGVTQNEASIISKNMYNDLNSDLINSYAWDTVIAYIEKCGTNQNYANKGDQSGILKKTGEYNDEECNINDISSNVYEWTTETYITNSSPGVYRGGSYNTMWCYPNDRYSSPDFMLNNDIGFRPILYF